MEKYKAAEQRQSSTKDGDVPQSYAAEGKDRVLKRLEMAEAQGLSPYELYILGDALWRHDDGESQSAFLLDRLAITPDREKLEAVIDRLAAGGWWPWDDAGEK